MPVHCVGFRAAPPQPTRNRGPPMPLTPADIHNMAFKKPPMGKRGYDEEEVDAFLDEVEQELIRLLEENGSLRDRAQRGGGGGGAASTMVINNEFGEIAAQLERAQEARA